MPILHLEKMWLWSVLFIIIISGLRGSTGQTVNQTSGVVTVTEGQSLYLRCAYEAQFSGINYPFWYIQHPGQPLKLLLASFSKDAQGFQATHHENKQKGTFNMQKPAIQLKDSAVYFCAFRERANIGNTKVFFGSGTRLVVMPNLKNSNPSVYQLEPKEKQSNLAACLITDYSPDPINVTFNSNEKSVNGSAVVVKEDGNKESASLGVVFWSTKDKFQCFATRGGNNYEAQREGDATCSETQSDTPVFETDENLNLLSLTVLGLRLIFFKSVALNLILTFWAWSR